MRLVLAFGVTAVLLAWPFRVGILRIRCTALVPRSSIALWQITSLTALACLLGTVVALLSLPFGGAHALVVGGARLVDGTAVVLTPNELFALTAGLILSTLLLTSVLARTLGVLRTRARYRMLVDLVAERSAIAPGACVVDHASPTAYCLPGFRSRIVLSSGAIDALGSDELIAVLAHERAHVRARHHLVLVPFVVLASLLPRSRALGMLRDEVRCLVEMAADDRAIATCDRSSLVRALCRLTSAETPELAFGAAVHGAVRRVKRALEERKARRLALCCIWAASASALALPFAMYQLVGPGWR